MSVFQHIATHLRQVHFGGNWSCSNLRDQLADVTWEQAVAPVAGAKNTIAVLAYHVGYYLTASIEATDNQPLSLSDKYAFTPPPITCEADWQGIKDDIFARAELAATRIEALGDERLFEPFVDEKYGNWARNLMGLIEHTHYHLGQIALLKAILRNDE